MTINVGVIAASGYAGGEAVRLLNSHPKANLSYITSRRLVSKFFHSVYPNFRSISSIKFEEYTVEKAKEKCDIVFLGVPHGISQTMVPELLDAGLKVIDLSADFRIKDKDVYQHYYKKEHSQPALLKDSVYGMPELHREEIKKANLIAVPGCQACSAIYALYPLIQDDLIQYSNIIVDSKTGSSGSGAVANESTHHPIRANSIRPYKMTEHRHTAEIEQELSALIDPNKEDVSSLRVGFSAHGVNLVRGILSTGHVFFNNTKEIDEKTLFRCYRKAFKGEPFMRLVNQKVGIFRLPDPKLIIGTNYVDVGFQIDSHMNRIVVLCALDNLVKGTAGNGIQCMNLMNGFEETMGLEFQGYFPL